MSKDTGIFVVLSSLVLQEVQLLCRDREMREEALELAARAREPAEVMLTPLDPRDSVVWRQVAQALRTSAARVQRAVLEFLYVASDGGVPRISRSYLREAAFVVPPTVR